MVLVGGWPVIEGSGLVFAHPFDKGRLGLIRGRSVARRQHELVGRDRANSCVLGLFWPHQVNSCGRRRVGDRSLTRWGLRRYWPGQVGRSRCMLLWSGPVASGRGWFHRR